MTTKDAWSFQKEGLPSGPRLIIEAAEQREIPWAYRKDMDLLALGEGSQSRWIRAMTTCRESDIAVEFAQDKAISKKLLEDAGVPVPFGVTVRTPDAARAALSEVGAPIVVKPVDGHKGKGVSVGVCTIEEMDSAFREAARHSKAVLIEEQLTGGDFRVLIVNGKVFAASQRIAAHVVGDGSHSIAELVNIENENPLRGVGREKPMTRILLDRIAQGYLKKFGLDLDDVPPPGQLVYLRGNANLSQGGYSEDVTDDLHPEIGTLCERAARIIGLPLCGIDLIAENVARSPDAQKLGIIEINAGPGIRLHHYPRRGLPRDAAGAILDYLYPAPNTGRIPCFGIFGSNEVTRGISHQLKATGLRVATATPTELSIDSLHLNLTRSNPQRLVFRDSSVDAALFQSPSHQTHCSVKFDVAVLMEATPAGIHEGSSRLRSHGTLVVNADHPSFAANSDCLNRHLAYAVLFSNNPASHQIRAHLNGGGAAIFRAGEEIRAAVGLHIEESVRVQKDAQSLSPLSELAVAAATWAFTRKQDCSRAS